MDGVSRWWSGIVICGQGLSVWSWSEVVRFGFLWFNSNEVYYEWRLV